tara:strand:- start:12200 stop:16045 length:3846 start_codon:yes stop_codon:yes gene_type:complete
MDIIKRKISPQVLLTEKTNPVLPTLNPKPLISLGINPFPTNAACVGYDYDACLSTIPGADINEMSNTILQIYQRFVQTVFLDNFSEGTSWWEVGSNQVPNTMILNFIFNNDIQYIESPNNPLVMLEVENPGNGTGTIWISSLKKVSLQSNTNYRVNVRLSSSILAQAIPTPNFLNVYIYEENSNNVQSSWYSDTDIPIFPVRDNISAIFTPIVTGSYEIGLRIQLSGSWNIGDFILIDDFGIVVEESPSDIYGTVEGVQKKIIEFAKGFNIEPNNTNITYYLDIIAKYLSSSSLPFEELPVGYYGTQSLDYLGNQDGEYTITLPPIGVIPFYYLSYNLYGTITDDFGEIMVNDGYLYCNGQDLGPWDGLGPDYFTGDLVEDTEGDIWYCNQDSVNSCNDCAPEDDCAWVKCLNIMGYQKGALNLNIPLYQDIKDIGLYKDMIYPGIAPECSGDTKTLTQNYKCPVPHYVSDGGEVIFYYPVTMKEVQPTRECCEDYDQYGFVWWEGKCYRDYGNSPSGQGKELFNFPYDMFFIDWADNQQLYVYNQTPTTVMIEGGANGEIFGGSGKRTLFHTPIIKNLIKDQKYIIKSKLVVDYYSNNTLSNFTWWATGDADPNWGVLYYDSYDLGWTVPNGIYLGSMWPGVTDCSTAIVVQTVENGDYKQHTTNCQAGRYILNQYLDQGKHYRVKFRYKHQSIGDTLIWDNAGVPTTSTIAIALGPNDIDFKISEGWGGLNQIYQLFVNNATGDIITQTIVPANSGVYNFEFQYNNPEGTPTCGPAGNFCIGDATFVYGFAFEYFLVEEIPFGLTDDIKVKVTPTKVWSSDISPSGVVIELESEVTSLINPWCDDLLCDNEYDCEGNQAGQCASIWNGNQVSLRLLCDVKNPIQSPPLQFRLNVEEISFKLNQKPNFLGCSKTQFLQQVAVTLPPDNNYPLNLDPTIGMYANTMDVQTTSVPYVNTVEGTNSLIIPAVAIEASADCNTTETDPIVGWVCDPDYVVPYNNGTNITYAGCIQQTQSQYAASVGYDSSSPLYATVQDCLAGTMCTETLGCTDPQAINFNPNANQPCAAQNVVNPPWPNTTGIIDDCCIYPTEGCTIMSATNWDPMANIDNGTCSFNQGCVDPTADNYFSGVGYCQVTMGLWGNVASCTDCNGNPPSEAFGLTNPDDGTLWYANAIVPGTLGNNSCCVFDATNDDPVGCTDPAATNYDINAEVPCTLGMLINGCCTYGLNEDVFCCLSVGFPIPCTGIYNINDAPTYNALLAQPDCYDENLDCATNTVCFLAL